MTRLGTSVPTTGDMPLRNRSWTKGCRRRGFGCTLCRVPEPPTSWTVDMVRAAERSSARARARRPHGPAAGAGTAGRDGATATARRRRPTAAGTLAYTGELTLEQLAPGHGQRGRPPRGADDAPAAHRARCGSRSCSASGAANALIAQGVPLEAAGGRRAAADGAAGGLPAVERCGRAAPGVRRARARPPEPGQAGRDRPVGPGPGDPRLQGDGERPPGAPTGSRPRCSTYRPSTPASGSPRR